MKTPKRQTLPGKLWIVATPIGNLGDLSTRAREVLQSAQGVLAEDTRNALKLGQALGIKLPKVMRLDAHTKVFDSYLEMLGEGQELALVSDAGTPGVSDPGSELVARVREMGGEVSAVPGPSAVATFLSLSGWEQTPFAFGGFLPRKVSQKFLGSLGGPEQWVFFESPQRILQSMEEIAQCPRVSQVVVAKELTKTFEKVVSGSAQEILEALGDMDLRGEWVVGLRLSDNQELEQQLTPKVQDLARWLLGEGLAPSQLAKKLSHSFDLPKNLLYEFLQKESEKNS